MPSSCPRSGAPFDRSPVRVTGSSRWSPDEPARAWPQPIRSVRDCQSPCLTGGKAGERRLMNAIINEPRRMNPLLRLGIFVAERTMGRAAVPARLLAWSPRTALGAGMLEATATHRIPGLGHRQLKLARLTASLTSNCAFCIDMNAHAHREASLSDREVCALRDGTEAAEPGFSVAERLIIAYARGLSSTPLAVEDELLAQMTETFDEHQLVVLAATIASVNYWARFNHGLGVPPAGFGDHCLWLGPQGGDGNSTDIGPVPQLDGADRPDESCRDSRLGLR